MKTMNTCAAISAALIALCAGGVFAQNFDSVVDSKASSANIDSAVVFDTVGTLIGDYDAETNPDGTQTRPGFFGGSGNNPIDTSTSIEADTMLDTHPAGSFGVNVDFDLGTINIDSLMIDLVNGQAGGTDLSVTMLYNTFHTINPSFLYPGGVPITIPIGQVGGVSEASLTQTGPGIGTITATENPSVFDIALVVPAQLDMVVNQSLPGSDPMDIPIDALPVALPIVGQLEVLGDDSIVVIMDLQPDPISMVTPIDSGALPDIPFELPTIGTETASVIFSATPESVSIDAVLGMSIVSSGSMGSCAADINGDGNLNFFDVSAFLNAFGEMDPAADFNGDGQFNFFDVSAFLTAFGEGCP